MQSHINARRYAGCRDDVPVVDEPIVGTHIDVFAERSQEVERRPVGCGRSTVKESCVSKHEGSCANTRHQRSCAGDVAHPGPDVFIAELPASALASRKDKNVDWRVVLVRVVGNDPSTLCAPDLSTVGRHREHVDSIVRKVELPRGYDLPRSYPIELLDPIEEDDAESQTRVLSQISVTARPQMARFANDSPDGRRAREDPAGFSWAALAPPLELTTPRERLPRWRRARRSPRG